jgi:hypothetical protein
MTIQELETTIRRDNHAPDTVIVDDMEYTMCHYDKAGEYIAYENKENGYSIEVKTSNRYSDTKFSDARVELYCF